MVGVMVAPAPATVCGGLRPRGNVSRIASELCMDISGRLVSSLFLGSVVYFTLCKKEFWEWTWIASFYPLIRRNMCT